ncbi:hypothetical protein QEV59_00090 [Trueperella pyogenes]|uniref:hypothetical protein n=1 Tax=Trueperella pyogenes TaxID=1661 RepID=UPI003133459D
MEVLAADFGYPLSAGSGADKGEHAGVVCDEGGGQLTSLGVGRATSDVDVALVVDHFLLAPRSRGRPV